MEGHMTLKPIVHKIRILNQAIFLDTYRVHELFMDQAVP